VIVIIIAVLFYYFLIEKTIVGYKIEATGVNPSAADAYGIDAKKVIYITFFIAGAFAGIAGAIEVLGVQQRLIAGFARTSGAEFATFGALSSLIAGSGALAIPITTFFLSVLLIGADSLQRTLQVPVEVIFVLQTILVLLTVTIRWQINKNI
jgi:simple sugar transport system permease protein